MYSLQNPNALDSKVLLDFDHVKNSLKIDDEGMLQHAATSFVSYKFLVVHYVAAFVVSIRLAMTPLVFYSQNYRE